MAISDNQVLVDGSATQPDKQATKFTRQPQRRPRSTAAWIASNSLRYGQTLNLMARNLTDIDAGY